MNSDAVIQFAYPDKAKVSIEMKTVIEQSIVEENKVFHIKREKELDIYLYNGQRLLFYTYRLKNIDGEIVTAEPMSNIWDDVLPNDLHSEGGVKLKKGKKPEKLLRRIIEMTTSKDDFVMDFHLGSGTTCAVAHKMGRKYIGIEQMDYIEDIAVERMKKVIDGEKGGVSKALNWKGGGSFVYAELKTIDNFADTPINKLNKNMQYLPISELEDKDYNISKDEIALNKKFYGLENE
jgi:adenine-specific DNA-methyltransferase